MKRLLLPLLPLLAALCLTSGAAADTSESETKPSTGCGPSVELCRCDCNGSIDTIGQDTCTLYYINGEASTSLVQGVSPDKCSESLRYPPCTQ